jgi:hypothetical protein
MWTDDHEFDEEEPLPRDVWGLLWEIAQDTLALTLAPEWGLVGMPPRTPLAGWSPGLPSLDKAALMTLTLALNQAQLERSHDSVIIWEVMQPPPRPLRGVHLASLRLRHSGLRSVTLRQGGLRSLRLQ